MTARFKKLDDLPLFASEEQIAAAILGPGRTVDWRGIAPLLEKTRVPGD
ncbi:hypothetical protein [Afipia carboxidovorans]|nr:hypothetical protein [Afipia carboxidovorans]